MATGVQQVLARKPNAALLCRSPRPFRLVMLSFRFPPRFSFCGSTIQPTLSRPQSTKRRLYLADRLWAGMSANRRSESLPIRLAGTREKMPSSCENGPRHARSRSGEAVPLRAGSRRGGRICAPSRIQRPRLTDAARRATVPAGRPGEGRVRPVIYGPVWPGHMARLDGQATRPDSTGRWRRSVWRARFISHPPR